MHLTLLCPWQIQLIPIAGLNQRINGFQGDLAGPSKLVLRSGVTFMVRLVARGHCIAVVDANELSSLRGFRGTPKPAPRPSSSSMAIVLQQMAAPQDLKPARSLLAIADILRILSNDKIALTLNCTPKA